MTLPPALACQRNTQDPPYSYAALGGAILKGLEGNQIDHLVGHDVQTADGSTITTDWDLQQE